MPRIEGIRNAAGGYDPVLIVQVDINGIRLEFPCIADSGADRTIVPAEYIEVLGIEFAKLSQTERQNQGAGGLFDARPCSGRLRWRQWEFCSEFLVAEPGCLPLGLLGRADFFKRFVVRFMWHKVPPTFDVDPVPTTA